VDTTRKIYSFYYGNILGATGVDGRIILRWIFRRWVGGYRMD
jgi:hypothetical protein